jgi:F420-0:gamma-glutamyl ligase
MARKKEKENEDSVLVTAAKAIGSAAGKVASMAGAAPTPPAKPKRPKLQAKNKHRLPRKVKKAQKKAAATL